MNASSTCIDQKIKSRPKVLHRYQQENLERARLIIESRYYHPLTLSELAGLAHMSVFHFCRLFKLYTDHTPHQYVQKRRMSAAHELLVCSTYSITEIAMRVGYNSVEYFATAFRQEYNKNPTQYRADHLLTGILMTTFNE